MIERWRGRGGVLGRLVLWLDVLWLKRYARRVVRAHRAQYGPPPNRDEASTRARAARQSGGLTPPSGAPTRARARVVTFTRPPALVLALALVMPGCALHEVRDQIAIGLLARTSNAVIYVTCPDKLPPLILQDATCPQACGYSCLPGRWGFQVKGITP